MGLDVWFREDIASALMAAERASATTAAAIGNEVGDPAAVRAYRQGFRAALATIAVAFGLEAVQSSINNYQLSITNEPMPRNVAEFGNWQLIIDQEVGG